jgi:hypothetical protein
MGMYVVSKLLYYNFPAIGNSNMAFSQSVNSTHDSDQNDLIGSKKSVQSVFIPRIIIPTLLVKLSLQSPRMRNTKKSNPGTQCQFHDFLKFFELTEFGIRVSLPRRTRPVSETLH